MRIPTFVAALALSSLPACLELEETIVFEADGSGTQKVHLGMTERILAEVQRAAPVLDPFGGSVSPLQIYDRAAVDKELKAAGLELREHKTSTERQRRFVDLEVSFAGLDALRGSPLLGPAAEWVFATGPKPRTIRLTLYPQGKQAWLDARLKAHEMRGEMDAVARSFFERRRKQLQGLDIGLNLELPGKVLLWTRNLEKTGERKVTATITSDQIGTPEELIRWLAPRFEVVFDGKGCTWPLAQ